MALSKEQVGERMRDPKVVILNVLPRKDFQKLHIKGSENHPMTDDPVEFSKAVVEKFGKGKAYVLYGDRFGLLESHMATRALIDHGQKAENYPGGLYEWHRAGLPVEGSATLPVQGATP